MTAFEVKTFPAQVKVADGDEGDAGVVEAEETTFTNAAAETAEDTAAAESALVYDEKTSAVKEITHFIPATKRILADEARLTSLVNERMVYGVRKRLQSQVVAGDGDATLPDMEDQP